MTDVRQFVPDQGIEQLPIAPANRGRGRQHHTRPPRRPVTEGITLVCPPRSTRGMLPTPASAASAADRSLAPCSGVPSLRNRRRRRTTTGARYTTTSPPAPATPRPAQGIGRAAKFRGTATL